VGTEGGMRSRRAEGAGGAGLAGRAGLPRKAGRRLLASGTGAGCGGQSLLKTPPIREISELCTAAERLTRLSPLNCLPSLQRLG